ncbi:MAG: SsrA-binding protein SmpB, partial [Weeksellaceae bacterium]|nr:SsrA-binding protein SmpB [Weeksellaceae bacterium]
MQREVNIKNKRARFEYELLEGYDAGIQLFGTEIKSIRMGKASITESFCQIKEGELYIINMFIDEYDWGTYFNHKTRRDRKLLLKKNELKKLERKTKETGLTIVAT